MDIEKRVSEAISHFWKTRKSQRENQGKESGQKDYGNRGAATGGKQLDGFIELFHDLLVGAGLPDSSIHAKTKRTLPGYFRPTKDWDLLIVVDSQLFASIEFKSHIGSFGNNFNNRVEEALGSATDLLTAYREGCLAPLRGLGWAGLCCLRMLMRRFFHHAASIKNHTLPLGKSLRNSWTRTKIDTSLYPTLAAMKFSASGLCENYCTTQLAWCLPMKQQVSKAFIKSQIQSYLSADSLNLWRQRLSSAQSGKNKIFVMGCT